MEELVYRANIDYEIALFDPKYQEHKNKYFKILKNFEYVFLFIEKSSCGLNNILHYADDYLQYIRQLGFANKIQLYPSARNAIPWWGKLKNIPLEKKLNSKVTSYEIAKEKNYAHESTKLIHHPSELKDYLMTSKHHEFILKNPHLMAGRGNHILIINPGMRSNEQVDQALDQLKNLTYPLIIEKKLKILAEVSCYIHIESTEYKMSSPYLNIVDSNGTHRGSLYHKDQHKLLSFLGQNPEISPNFKIIKSTWPKIIDSYLKLGAFAGLSLDSFIYEEDKVVKPYILSEINYRKTMGLMLFAVSHLIPEDSYILWKIYPIKKNHIRHLSFDDVLQKIKSKLFKLNDSNGIILTSPIHHEINHFSLYYIFNSKSDFEELESFFLEKIYSS